MKKSEFIKWLESKCFEKRGIDEYRELMNYSENIYDEISVDENSVTFSWEEWYWGGIDYKTKEMTFEDFIENYENDTLKN